MATLTITQQLVTVDCPNCRIEYAIPKYFNDQGLAHKSQVTIYCPNGHAWHYTGKTEAQRLKDEKADLERRLDSLKASKDFWQNEHEVERKRHAATKGVLTKTKKRVANGVCPCCNRSFVQLERHMKTKHPTYAEAQS